MRQSRDGLPRSGGLWAVVPVKRFAQTKQRLAGVLGPEARELLGRTMFAAVLDALKRAPSLAGILVVTADPDAAAMALEAGGQVVDDEDGEGTAAAAALAMRRLAAEGRGGMLVLPADIPAITTEEIEALVAAHDRKGARLPAVTLVPAETDGGTNALVCSPPDALPPCFGEDSFRRHHQAARSLGIEPAVLRLPGIGHDIDTPADLEAFMATPASRRTGVHGIVRPAGELSGVSPP